MRDCSEATNREHWLSKTVLEQVGKTKILVEGLHWQLSGQKQISPNTLQSKILCVRHNKALSPLDVVAGSLFKVCQRYQTDMQSEAEFRLFSLFDGRDLEMWFLKFLLGGIASTSLRPESRPHVNPTTIVDHDLLVERLFRGEAQSQPIRLYQHHQRGRPISRSSDIELRAAYNSDGVATGCGIAFGPVVLHLALGSVPRVGAGRMVIVRPAGVVIQSTIADAQAVIALGWEAGDAEMTIYDYTGEGSGDASQRPGIFS